MGDIKNVDRRQIESLMTDPGVSRRLDPAEFQRWGSFVEKEKGKTKWVKEGNIILPSGEFVSRGDWMGLPYDERELLRKLGIGSFNQFKETHLKIGKNWFSSNTHVFKVLQAVRDGFTTYEEVEQVTGVDKEGIDDAVSILKKGGYLS